MRSRSLLVILFLVAACGKREEPRAKQSGPPTAAAESPKDEGSLFRIHFNDPEIPATPDRSQAHPGPEDAGPGRAGFTRGDLSRKVGINWERTADGKLYAASVDVDFRMTIAILVSSRFAEGGCPYRVTWEHELDHAHAFHSIFEASQVHLTSALEHSQESEPKLPTKAAPAVPKTEEIDAFKQAAAEKVAAVVEDQARVTQALMEDHRRSRDSPQAYQKDTDKCPAEDWQVLLR